MFFKLDVVKNDRPLTWFFDNKTLAVYDEYRNNINTPSSYFGNYQLATEDYNINQVDQILEICLYVGGNCNYACKYCPQIQYKNQAHNAKVVDVPKLKALLEKTDLSELKAIMITGGEPLIYWKAFREIIAFFYEKCPKLENFRFVTNGELLTDAVVKECKEKRLKIVVSEDGGSNKTRKERSKEETLKRFAKYNEWAEELGTDFVIRYQLGAHHLDAVKMYHYFKQQIPSIKSIADHHVIESVMPHSSDVTEQMVYFNTLSAKQLRLLSDSRLYLLLANKPELRNTHKKLIGYLDVFKHGFNLFQFPCKLPYGKYVHLDFAGNILKCLWTPTKENIAGNLSDIHNVNLLGYIPYQKRKYCSRCPLLNFCAGVCAIADEPTVQQSCKLYYADKLAYFKAVFKILWGVDIRGIYPLEGDPIPASKVFNNYVSNYEAISKEVPWEFKL